MATLAETLEKLSRRLDESERRPLIAEVARAKGLTTAQARRLQGSTRSELEADADELLKLIAPPPASDGGGRTDRTKERLRSGAVSDEDDYDSPEKVADRARGPWGGSGDFDAEKVADAVRGEF